MEFKEALEILGIEKYSERIINSNSKGNLFHIPEYYFLAKDIDNKNNWFAGWFEAVVNSAEENWERPESVFQHIAKILSEQITEYRLKN
tara:strand:- start:242 stop:508 length:267 start_codon:yes stop_codon:yes gene_type:complete